MTSLIAWIGVDSRGQTSAYLASDSRISWGEAISFDTGVKLFASTNSAEIFGYCGDVTFPSQILQHTIDQINNDLLFSKKDSIKDKTNKIFELIKNDFSEYPSSINKGFEILYFSRENSKMKSKFHLSKFQWNNKDKWRMKTISLPHKSGLVDYTGSGAKSIFEWYRKWQNTEVKETSRSVFSAFCDSIYSKEDPYTGGSAQLVGLYRIGNGINFGIIHNNQRFIRGKPIKHHDNIDKIKWRNRLFERCDGRSMKIKSNAQKQPKPSTLT